MHETQIYTRPNDPNDEHNGNVDLCIEQGKTLHILHPFYEHTILTTDEIEEFLNASKKWMFHDALSSWTATIYGDVLNVEICCCKSPCLTTIFNFDITDENRNEFRTAIIEFQNPNNGKY